MYKNTPKEKKIGELESWEYVKVKGKILKSFGLISYSKGKFQPIILGDETGTIKAIIWNTDKELPENTVIEAIGKTKINKKTGNLELHIDSYKILESDLEIKPQKQEFVGICIVKYPKKQTQKGTIVSKAILTSLDRELPVVYFNDFDWEIGHIYKVYGKLKKNIKTGKIEFFADKVEEATLKDLKAFKGEAD